ncbi:MAG: transglycosylase SLT domain-containing protein [Alphaproteobacteria bacterium]|nr:transglycosylase SLT domain-containing protein [Alphaproteobacteria bacterium]
MGSQVSIAGAINSVVTQPNRGVSSHIVNAIQKAANQTGVDFSYLMNKASQESSFDPQAKAKTSSATGLFQFTSQTWLHMIKEYGEDYGLGSYAAQITRHADGKLSVSNSEMRKAILALRKDPQISAEMAGELDKENEAYLSKKVGGKIGATELYLAHFLGAYGASRFINEMRANPGASGADLLPTAAAANQSVFYSKSGEAKSLTQIYQRYAQKFENTNTRYASVEPQTTVSASRNVAAIRVASLMPTQTAATSSAYDVPDIAGMLESQTARSSSIASTGSTLFNAMVFGQIQQQSLDTTALSAYTQDAENRKKNPYSAYLNAVG